MAWKHFAVNQALQVEVMKVPVIVTLSTPTNSPNSVCEIPGLGAWQDVKGSYYFFLNRIENIKVSLPWKEKKRFLIFSLNNSVDKISALWPLLWQMQQTHNEFPLNWACLKKYSSQICFEIFEKFKFFNIHLTVAFLIPVTMFIF